MSEPAPVAFDDEPVEVARAHDSLEAYVWVRQLEDQGLSVTTKRIGGVIRWVLYLGRVPVSIRVPRKDQERAREFLHKTGFI